MNAPPYAALLGDVTAAPGQESARIDTENLSHAAIAVHQYSVGQFGLAQVTVSMEGVAGGPRFYQLPSVAQGTWWHVANVNGDDLTVTSVNRVSEQPPADLAH